MGTSLYFMKGWNIGEVFGIKPHAPSHWQTYMTLDKRIGLKDDLRWHEVSKLQNMLTKADIWPDFPADGLTLVVAEVAAGDENQRLDLLYLRNDGALLPCEIKIGGEARDPHGQLLRYISDLRFQSPTVECLRKFRTKQLAKVNNPAAKDVHEDKFENFVKKNGITDKFIRILPRSGILIDEDFKPAVLKAVRYMNDDCGFSIRLIQIRSYVKSDWKATDADFFMRLDFVDVQ